MQHRIEKITYRIPCGRVKEAFSVVPFFEDAKEVKLISKNRAMVIDLKANTLRYSKFSKKQPAFICCLTALGGKEIPLPDTLKDTIKTLTPKQRKPQSHSGGFSNECAA